MNQGINKQLRTRISNPLVSCNAIKEGANDFSEMRARSIKKIGELDQQEQFHCYIKGKKLTDGDFIHHIEKQDMQIGRIKPPEHSNSIPPIFPSQIKRHQFRTREKRVLKTSKLQVKVRAIDNKSLAAFYRYQIVSLFTLLNRRDDYINSLKNKGNQFVNDPIKSNQLEERLKNQILSKGKDKGRVKFNHLTNQQLRSLKYKAKASYQTMVKKNSKGKDELDEDEEQQEEEGEQKESKITDMQTWKKQNGVGYNRKIFIVKGGYHQLRKALLERGWYENQDVWSPFFDLKWTTRICDINYLQLKNGQSVNHFNNNHHLTSKYGITRRMRTLTLGHNVDADKFYPRCFDLGDQVDFQNFVQNFKYGFAESVARRFLVDKKRYQNFQLKIRITVDILRRRTLKFSNIVHSINQGQFLTITPEEWFILTQTAQYQITQQKLDFWRKNETQDLNDPEYLSKVYQRFDLKVKQYLQILKTFDPQVDINGFRNVWIVKPNFLSRGRGIRCFNNLYDISDYCLGRDVQFVVQKYIENPLLVEGKKFDIRQWVLIQDYLPPKIWFYEECYIRFCADDYSLDNIYNRFIHLTNNSIQKYNKNHVADKSMWTMKEFAQFVGEDQWKIIQQKMINIVIWSIKSCQGNVVGRKGSSQLVGYDFMIDQNLNPWLIEINMSPSMDSSTPVTKKLVKMVLRDTVKVISSNKKNKDTGNFTCVYEGNEDSDKYNIYKF